MNPLHPQPTIKRISEEAPVFPCEVQFSDSETWHPAERNYWDGLLPDCRPVFWRPPAPSERPNFQGGDATMTEEKVHLTGAAIPSNPASLAPPPPPQSTAAVPEGTGGVATPRTDAAESDGWSGDAMAVDSDFARQLERELEEMRRTLIVAQQDSSAIVDRFVSLQKQLRETRQERDDAIRSEVVKGEMMARSAEGRAHAESALTLSRSREAELVKERDETLAKAHGYKLCFPYENIGNMKAALFKDGGYYYYVPEGELENAQSQLASLQKELERAKGERDMAVDAERRAQLQMVEDHKQLQALRKAGREVLADWDKKDGHLVSHFHGVVKPKIERLRAALQPNSGEAIAAPMGREGASDTQRLDWLTQSGYSVCRDIGFSKACEVWACFEAYPVKPISTNNPFPMYDSPRTAIDAAMSATPPVSGKDKEGAK